MPYHSKCAKCDKNAVLRWTLFNGQVAAVAPLCMEHGACLSELVAIVGPKPVLHTGTMPVVPAKLPKARPLTGWVKPEDD